MKFCTLLSTLAVFLLPAGALVEGENVCDVVDQGTTFDPNEDGCDIYVMHKSFLPMIRGSAIKLRHEAEDDIFHEGPVLFDDALYFVSNRLGPDSNSKASWGKVSPPLLNQYIEVWKMDLESNNLEKQKVHPTVMANGMTKTADGNNILMLSQGFNTTGGAIFEFDRDSQAYEPILNSYFGRQLNSPNDIEITSDGVVFFSDPPYGFEQGFRTCESPMLGSNVYRYDTKTKRQTVLTTTLVRPNGVALFDDRQRGMGCTLFLSDTGFETAPYKHEDIQSPRALDGFGDSTIYMLEDDGEGCFSPEDGPWAHKPIIPTTKGIQDGMEFHHARELLFYCDGSGLWIFSLELHQLIGLVKVPSEDGKCVQVIFPQKLGVQDVFILAEKKLFHISMDFGEEHDTCAVS